MKKVIFLLLLCANLPTFSQVDYSSSWEDFYSYNNVKDFIKVDNVIYALAGHFAGNVKTNANSTRGSKKPLDPSAYTTFKEFKAAVRAATSDHQRAAAQKYQDLRKSNPGLADRFLSTFFKPKSAFCIALSCPKTGNLLTKAQMVDEWTQNIKSRASTVIDCDPLTSAQNIANITRIRATGAASSALGSTATVGIDDSPYTVQEVTEVVDKMSASKHCLGMPYSALKALCPSGRELTRVLANLGLHFCLTSPRWSVRVLNVVRKAGPHVVRQVNNLRPISLANDMAQIQDALWIRRAAPVLDAFAGEGQLGGSLDPVTLILILYYSPKPGTIKVLQLIWLTPT